MNSSKANKSEPDFLAFKECCSKLLPLVDSSSPSVISTVFNYSYIIHDVDETRLKKIIKRGINSSPVQALINYRNKWFLKLSKKKYKAATILRKYNKIINKAKEYNIPYVIAIDVFLYYLYNGGFFNSAGTVLKKISRRQKSSLYYLYTMGSIYFDRATKIKMYIYVVNHRGSNTLLFIDPIRKYCLLALKYFSKAIKMDPLNNTLYYLISSCYLYLRRYKEYNRFIESYSKKYSEIHHKIEHNQIPPIIDIEDYKIVAALIALQHESAFYLMVSREFQKAINALTRIDKSFRNNQTYLLLDNAYTAIGKYQDSITILDNCKSKVYLFHRLIGGNFLELSKFHDASIHFAEEIKLLARRSTAVKYEAEILYNYTHGMWNWKRGFLDQARDNFQHCIELIKKKKFYKYSAFQFLPDLMDIDKRIDFMVMSTSIEDFTDHLYAASMKVEKILYAFHRAEAQGVKQIRDNFIYSLTYFKHNILLYLFYNSLTNEVLGYLSRKNLNKSQKKIFCRNIETNFEKSINWFNKLGFKPDVNISKGIKSFVKKLGSRQLSEIPGKEWSELRKTLSPSLEFLGKDLTQHITNIYISGGVKIVTISSGRKPIKGEELEIPEVDDEKKIKILTNAKVDKEGKVCEIYKEVTCNEITEEDLKKMEENINNYLIWLDCKTGMCFIFGKQFARTVRDKRQIDPASKKPVKKRKLTTVGKKFRRWIVYLIKNNGKKNYYSEHYKIYNNTQYGTVDHKRKYITKVRLVLLDYSNGDLEDYIIYTPGVELGLDIKSKAVCVVNIDLIKSNS